MASGIVHTLCRLFAAFVCVLSAGELFTFSTVVPPAQGHSEMRAGLGGDDVDFSSEAPDSREEREERADDEDDDLDDSRHGNWASYALPHPVLAPLAFPPAQAPASPRPSHLSLDPRPPRRA
jgi:hypothetical protein